MGFLSNSDKKKLEKAAAAAQKLNRYSKGLAASGSRDTNPKFDRLNSDADRAIRDLPAHLRARVIVERFQK
jgi:hypothetical protein